MLLTAKGGTFVQVQSLEYFERNIKLARSMKNVLPLETMSHESIIKHFHLSDMQLKNGFSADNKSRLFQLHRVRLLVL